MQNSPFVRFMRTAIATQFILAYRILLVGWRMMRGLIFDLRSLLVTEVVGSG